jgi:hypothetical protein
MRRTIPRTRVSPPETAATATRLYGRFIRPLVLGGDVLPGPAVGARAALSLAHGLLAIDTDLRSKVDLARVRVARALWPVDTISGPDEDEWALAAAIHDALHALHPDLTGLVHRRVPDRLFDYAEQVILRVKPAGSLRSLLSRHTLFSRVFDVARTDTVVSWWSESRTFRGRMPPPRLLAWPGVRRVRVRETNLSLADLARSRGEARMARFSAVVSRWLEMVPLTDLATVTRSSPEFEWSGPVLGLFSTPHARALALRALDRGPREAVDRALGRATKRHPRAKPLGDLGLILDVLGERSLALASTELPVLEPAASDSDDVLRARALGAAVAVTRLPALHARQAETVRMRRRLEPLLATSDGGQAIEVVRRFGEGYFLAVLGKAAGSVGGSSTSSDA